MNDAINTVYIEVPGLGWQNRPYIVLGYNIPNETFSRITDLDENEGQGAGVSSHSGRYIAFSSYVRAGYMGTCSYEFIQIVDFQKKGHAAVYLWGPQSPSGIGNGSITNLSWLNETTLSYAGKALHDASCDGHDEDPTPIRGTVDLARLKFQ